MGSNSTKLGRKNAGSIVPLPCACASLRRATRLVTQLYEEAMRPTGLTGPQFTLLQALKLAPGISQKMMGEILGIDSTTLTRSLALLRKQGWIIAEPGSDRRVLRLALTKSGEREYERALPYWHSAQESLKQKLGKKNWKKMTDAVTHTTEAIQ